MKKTNERTNGIHIIVLLLVLSITMSLVGCGTDTIPITLSEKNSSNQEVTTAPSIEPVAPSEDITESSIEILPEAKSEEMTSSREATTELATLPVITPTEVETDEQGLTEQQRNSFSMLYHLAIIAEEIRFSQNNRLLLEDIYTSLLNDINPGAIDETTQAHLKNLRDIIKSYIDNSVKREHLQYIYNQDKAAAIRSAVSKPLTILSNVGFFNWEKLAKSVVYTIVDSYNEHKSTNEAIEATETIDQTFLLNGWELDEKEMAAIRKNRENVFDYMVDIVQEYGLDGKLTLNEKAIENFAQICAIESLQQKIRRLESEEETYKLLGNYWLELADCYYETSQYQKCLDCVDKYNALATGIYRKDYNYVQILPKVIVAAQNIYSGDAYVSNIGTFTDAIIENTTTDEWSIRYFAAQVYLDLYAKTNDREYLEAAYNIAYDNITILLDEQQALNTTYLEDVKEVEVKEPDYNFLTEEEKKEAKQEYKNEQKQVKAYNKALKENRKTELPSLYEPLILNCDLLFALADEMHISDLEKRAIEEILQTNNNGVFLTEPINNQYSFSVPSYDYSIDFSKDEMVIPVVLLTTKTEIDVTVTDDDKNTSFDDCIITKVERKADTAESFYAHISSKQMKSYEWTENSKVVIKLINGDKDNPLIFRFKVAEYKDNWLISDKVVFEKE